MPPRVTVLGGANTDFLVRAARLPLPGETVTGDEFDHAGGGKGSNQAIAAARLGAKVTFLGCVGADDRGRALLRGLKAEGIDVRHVTLHRHVPTGVALINVDASGEKQIIVAPGANLRLRAADIRRPAIARAITRADVLLLQFEVPMATNLAAARLAHQAGVPIVLDPAPALEGNALSFPLLRFVTALRANEHEAEALTGIRVQDRASAKQAAMELLERFTNLRATIISAGTGNLVVWKEGDGAPTKFGTRFIQRLRVKAVDATGAGDAFAAAFAVAFAEGQTIPKAAEFANAAAALATTKLGAQPGMPSRAAVRRLLGTRGR
jgi:ribokinase